jgi:hypothetical protein
VVSVDPLIAAPEIVGLVSVGVVNERFEMLRPGT